MSELILLNAYLWQVSLKCETRNSSILVSHLYPICFAGRATKVPNYKFNFEFLKIEKESNHKLKIFPVFPDSHYTTNKNINQNEFKNILYNEFYKKEDLNVSSNYLK